MKKRILFIGYCWGTAGSTWLSHLLNSHPDILCLHSPQLPHIDGHDVDAVLSILDFAFEDGRMGQFYPFVGFTHGVLTSWHDRLLSVYGDRLRGFVLVRHPVKRIQSYAALNRNIIERGLMDPKHRRFQWEIYERLCSLSTTRFPKDPESLGFYNACFAVNEIEFERTLDLPIFKLEGLVSREQDVQELVGHISDNQIRMETSTIGDFQRRVIASHSNRNLSVADTLRSWSEERREAYHLLVRPQAIRLYARLGYDFPLP